MLLLRPNLHGRFLPRGAVFLPRGFLRHLELFFLCPYLHFLTLATARHFFAAALKALRACKAVLIFEPLSLEIRHFLKPGFILELLRRLTMCLCPGDECETHLPLSLWQIHVTSLHRVMYWLPVYITFCQKSFENLYIHTLLQ